MKLISAISLFVLFTCTILNAQYNGSRLAVYFNYTFTNSSKLFLNPNSSDQFIRNEYVDIKDILSQSVDVRYRISESVIIGISSELINKKVTGRNYSIGGRQISAEEGFKITPIELSGYYFLPFSTEAMKFYMGGGLGFYFGEHIRNFGDVHTNNIKSKNSLGILVAVGMDYIVYKMFSIRAELKFRDPEVEMENKYSKDRVQVDGRLFLLPRNNFFSKVNLDGVNFRIGIVLNIL